MQPTSLTANHPLQAMCILVNVNVYACACLRACVRACMRVCVRVCARVCVYVCIGGPNSTAWLSWLLWGFSPQSAVRRLGDCLFGHRLSDSTTERWVQPCSWSGCGQRILEQVCHADQGLYSLFPTSVLQFCLGASCSQIGDVSREQTLTVRWHSCPLTGNWMILHAFLAMPVFSLS